MPERLVVMRPHDARAELAHLQQHYRVSSVFQPRMAVVDLDAYQAAAVENRPGIQHVMADSRAPAPSGLNDTERLFVRAWMLSQNLDKAQRSGDGLGWDTDGFLRLYGSKPARWKR